MCFLFSLFVLLFLFVFFTDTATTEIYTLSLHDLFRSLVVFGGLGVTLLIPTIFTVNLYVITLLFALATFRFTVKMVGIDRKSTRLNSSHLGISYAVFCLKKKNENKNTI